MPVETDDDRAAFLDPDLFGTEAVYMPRDGAEPVTVNGIFDEPASNFNPNQWPGSHYQMQLGAHLAQAGPTYRCAQSDLPDGGKQRSKLTVNGKTYRVQEPRQDGAGMVDLILMEDE